MAIIVSNFDRISLPQINGGYVYATSIAEIDIFVELRRTDVDADADANGFMGAHLPHKLVHYSDNMPLESSHWSYIFKDLSDGALVRCQEKDNALSIAEEWLQSNAHLSRRRRDYSVVTLNSQSGEILMYSSRHIGSEPPVMRVSTSNDTGASPEGYTMRRADRSVVRGWQMYFERRNDFIFLSPKCSETERVTHATTKVWY